MNRQIKSGPEKQRNITFSRGFANYEMSSKVAIEINKKWEKMIFLCFLLDEDKIQNSDNFTERPLSRAKTENIPV